MASRYFRPKGRVLVVDDDEDTRKFLVDLLSHWGFEVIPASSGWAALDIVERKRVDLVLLDVTMPELDGVDTLRGIKRMAPELAVIMMSALMTAELGRHLCEIGAQGCLAKPVERKTLRLSLVSKFPVGTS